MSDTPDEVLEVDSYEEMSDEDFLNQEPGAVVDTPAVADEPAVVDEPAVAVDTPAEPAADAQDDVSDADLEKKPVVAAEAVTPKQTKEGEPDPATPEVPPVEAANYETLYKQVMGTFKANGKDFTPSTPDEAVRLMQMGVNYTQKMQALQPNLKLMRMLSNNGLLDESKLSYLIDLDKKDPKAIQKLLHDGKIDPLELDPSAKPDYVPGNHAVTDQEETFHSVLDDVKSTAQGQATIVLVNSWDQASKKAIYAEPAVLKLIDEQRSNGIYDVIATEIERERILGNLTNVPFIQAYKEIGNRLHAAGKLPVVNSSPPPQANKIPAVPSRQVLETRAATPKSQVVNDDRVRAASPGARATSKSVAREFDVFAMSDDEIMKIAPPRS